MHACKICGVDVSQDFWKDVKKHSLFKCHACKTVFVMPYVDELVTKPIYENNEKSECEYYVRTMLEDAKTFNKRLKFIEQYIPEDKRGVFDFGCSIGTFLRAAKDRGWYFLAGCDLNKKALGFSEDDPYIQTYSFIPCLEVNFVHVSDVLEHVPNPKKLLSEVKEQLVSGGYVMFTTPNIGSLFAKLLGGRWHAIKPPEHLFYFTKKSVKVLAKELGFEIVKVGWSWRYRRLGTIIEHLSVVSGFGKWLKKNVPQTIKDVVVPFSIGDELLVVMKK